MRFIVLMVILCLSNVNCSIFEIEEKDGPITRAIKQRMYYSYSEFDSIIEQIAEGLLGLASGIEKISLKQQDEVTEVKGCKDSVEQLELSLQSLKLNLYTGANCAELRKRDDVNSGVRTIYPYGIFNDKPVRAVVVYCDQITDGGGWTVFQNRADIPARETFARNQEDYIRGFGDVNGEFWLGLENIHALVNSTPMELRVDLEDFEGDEKWAKYGSFSISDALSKYTLAVGNYSGDAGDSLDYHNGMKFSTHDQDNDEWSLNCAETFRAGWWYNACIRSNLNGFQYIGKAGSSANGTYKDIPNTGDGISWYEYRGIDYSLKTASMKVRPTSFSKNYKCSF